MSAPPPPPRRHRRYIPLEVVPIIFSFTEPIAILRRCALVCHAWSVIVATDHTLWESLAAPTAKGKIATRATLRQRVTGGPSDPLRRVPVRELQAAAIVRCKSTKASAPPSPRGLVSQNGAADSPAPVTTSEPSISQRASTSSQSLRVRTLQEWTPTTMSVSEELNTAAAAFYQDIRPSDQSNDAMRLAFLESQHEVLTRRIARASSACVAMLPKAAKLLESFRDLGRHVEREEAQTTQLLGKADAFEHMVDTRKSEIDAIRQASCSAGYLWKSLMRFESLVCRKLLAEFSDGGAASLDSFFDLEMFTLLKNNRASMLAVHWGHLKRTIPVDTAYFALWDVATTADAAALHHLCLDGGSHCGDETSGDAMRDAWARVSFVLQKFNPQTSNVQDIECWLRSAC